MEFADYLQAPWKSSHPAYEKWDFVISPAPEYASSEILLASLYRVIGFAELRDGAVPAAGKAFDKKVNEALRRKEGRGMVTPETWQGIVQGVLESPKRPSQSQRYLHMTPMVPDIARYSGSPRRTEKSWVPGPLISRMVSLGADGPEQADALWRQLFDCLSVSDKDDVWARWLEGEFREWTDEGAQGWSYVGLQWRPTQEATERTGLAMPAQQFVRDLKAVMAVKPSMTRRQWLSLLEAVLRLASVSHVMWLCAVHERLWGLTRAVVEDGNVPSDAEIQKRLFEAPFKFLGYGTKVKSGLKDQIARYLNARMGLNALLWDVAKHGEDSGKYLNSIGGLRLFLEEISSRRTSLAERRFLPQLADARERETRVISCSAGIGANVFEFANYVLAKQLAAVDVLRGYDQSYLMNKLGEHRAAHWGVSLGPVAVMAFVHCCLHGFGGPRSVHRLTEHLARYGLEVEHKALPRLELGKSLRVLGLVLDSPDAESGMLLLPPFASTSR